MKSIGIITILKVNNYGAELQAFALQRKMNLMGYKAQIIDYLFYKHKNYKREKCSVPFYPYPFKKRTKELLLPFIEKLKCLPYQKKKKKRDEAFEQFHKKNTSFSSRTYSSYSQLYDNPPQYDVYCVGSDQVWNPNCYTSLNPYFLTFAPKDKKRFSYASSFGVSSIPLAAKPFYHNGLKNLTKISVRENTGNKLVKELTDNEAKVVADPTLLLNKKEWLEIANTSKIPSKPYLLLYVLKNSNYITEQAKILAHKHKLQIVRICKGAFIQDKASSGIINILDAAPDDFVGLFSNASLILTNSFHGTVFSVLFERDFYTILPKGKDNNSRQIDLLSRLEINERLIYEGDILSEEAPIKYDAVNKIIDQIRIFSENYIKDAVE